MADLLQGATLSMACRLWPCSAASSWRLLPSRTSSTRPRALGRASQWSPCPTCRWPAGLQTSRPALQSRSASERTCPGVFSLSSARQPLCIAHCLEARWKTWFKTGFSTLHGLLRLHCASSQQKLSSIWLQQVLGCVWQPCLPLLKVGVWSLLAPSEKRPFAWEVATASSIILSHCRMPAAHGIPCTSLRILALHNCKHIAADGLAYLAACCPGDQPFHSQNMLSIERFTDTVDPIFRSYGECLHNSFSSSQSKAFVMSAKRWTNAIGHCVSLFVLLSCASPAAGLFSKRCLPCLEPHLPSVITAISGKHELTLHTSRGVELSLLCTYDALPPDLWTRRLCFSADLEMLMLGGSSLDVPLCSPGDGTSAAEQNTPAWLATGGMSEQSSELAQIGQQILWGVSSLAGYHSRLAGGFSCRLCAVLLSDWVAKAAKTDCCATASMTLHSRGSNISGLYSLMQSFLLCCLAANERYDG